MKTAAPMPATISPQSQPPSHALTGTPTTTRTIVVHFDTASADIKASAMQILYGATRGLDLTSITSVRVRGYADASGRRGYNQKLSERRAAAVADQLGKLGVKATSLKIEGMGAVGGKAKARSKEDRRVEVVIETIATAALAPEPGERLSATRNAPEMASLPVIRPGSADTTVAGPASPTPPARLGSAPLRSEGKQAIKLVRAVWAAPPAASPDAA
ncbi:MAG: OmpA family protein [Magnetospirillum sp.]|nr:OmpA family protein [Magnetospirillum sp.]